MDENEKIHIFISYNHLDHRIAKELNSCLVALSESISAFIDHASIGPGEEYEKKIAASIKASTWFIMVNPGTPSTEKDIGWCLYEAGQFRSRMSSQEIADKKISERICLIYDVNIPSQFSQYQAIRVQDRTSNDVKLNLDSDNVDIENTPVFALFTAILEKSKERPIRNSAEPAVRTLIRDQARRFIKAFLTLQDDTKLSEVPLQVRISLILPAPPSGGLAEVDPATEVVGWGKALPEVFGITGQKTSWGEIKKAFRLTSGADALWVQDLEEALISIASNKVPTQTEPGFPGLRSENCHTVYPAARPSRSGPLEIVSPVTHREAGTSAFVWRPRSARQRRGRSPRQHVHDSRDVVQEISGTDHILPPAQAKWRVACLVDEGVHLLAPLQEIAPLIPHAVGGGCGRRHENEHGSTSVERLLDGLIPVGPGTNVPIEPQGDAHTAELGGQRVRIRVIGSRVAHEHRSRDVGLPGMERVRELVDGLCGRGIPVARLRAH
jgi:hypothetical protein